MSPEREVFAEMPTTVIDYARIRIIVENPDKKRSQTSAIILPDHQLEDFKREAEAREQFKFAMHGKDTGMQWRAKAELQEAKERADRTRNLIADQLVRHMSEALS